MSFSRSAGRLLRSTAGAWRSGLFLARSTAVSDAARDSWAPSLRSRTPRVWSSPRSTMISDTASDTSVRPETARMWSWPWRLTTSIRSASVRTVEARRTGPATPIYLGHGLGHLGTAGDGAHVVLALAADHVDQVRVGQDGRGAQDRPGDVDLILGQAPDQAGRGVGRLGETGGQFRADGRLHLLRQGFEDGAVKLGLGHAVLDAAQEVVGQFAQQQPALLAGGLVGQGDQIGQARAHDDGPFFGGGFGHGRSSPVVWGMARTEPSLLRCRAGGPSGCARSADDGVWVISTGRASR